MRRRGPGAFQLETLPVAKLLFYRMILSAKSATFRSQALRRPQPRQRIADLAFALLRLVLPLALLLDHLFRRAANEVRVAELGVDLGDVRFEFLNFLLEPGHFGREIDDAFERQRS